MLSPRSMQHGLTQQSHSLDWDLMVCCCGGVSVCVSVLTVCGAGCLTFVDFVVLIKYSRPAPTLECR